jgi:UDP-3-O-[3-hydroxymyristoyl] glucosamine N-acyltransferase
MVPGVRLPEPLLVSELVARHGGRASEAAARRRVATIVSPADASDPADLVVLTSARQLSRAEQTNGVLLCSEPLSTRLVRADLWIHPHAEWALAGMLDGIDGVAAGVARSAAAVIDPAAELAPDVRVGAGAVIQAGVRVGAGSVIGENAVVYANSHLGRRVIVGPSAVIGRPGFGWVTGPAGQRRRMPQLGGVRVEDEVEIGPLCTIDSGTLGPTRIRRGAKLDAHVHVGHNVDIGAGCLVAAQTGFAGSVILGEETWVGGQSGFKDHVRVGRGARIAAKSGVIGDVPDGAVVAGFPAVPRTRWLRAMARLLGRSKQETSR